MRRAFTVIGIAFLVIVIAIQFVRPNRTNPAFTSSSVLAAHVAVPDDVAAVLDRACRDCHSNQTHWPWYSQVAPLSWFVADHVNHGRSHFNYSNWTSYRQDEADRLLENTCSLAKKRAMPLGSYLLMHSSARLSPADVDLLCRWTERARAESNGRVP